MRCVVSEVKEERILFVGSLLLDVVDGPSREHFGGMALGLDRFFVASHPVDAPPQVGPIVVHHVGEKAVEEIEASIIWDVGRLET